jgi:hypothetical protein
MLTVDETGRESAVKLLAESALQMRLPELGDILPAAVTNLLALPVAELTLFVEQLPQLSADELRERLGKTRVFWVCGVNCIIYELYARG